MAALKKFLQAMGSKAIDYGVLCTLLFILTFKSCKQDETIKSYVAEKQLLEQRLKDDSSAITYYEDENKNLLTRAQMAEASSSEIVEELFGLQKVNERFRTDIKNLQIAIQTRKRDTVLIYQDTGSVKIQYTTDSSAFALTGTFNNPWYMAKAKVSSDIHKIPGSLSLVVMDTTLITVDKKRVGSIFNRRDEYSVSILHANPYVKELGVKSVVVSPAKPKKWAISLQTGTMLLPTPGQLYLGVGISRNLIQF